MLSKEQVDWSESNWMKQQLDYKNQLNISWPKGNKNCFESEESVLAQMELLFANCPLLIVFSLSIKEKETKIEQQWSQQMAKMRRNIDKNEYKHDKWVFQLLKCIALFQKA